MYLTAQSFSRFSQSHVLKVGFLRTLIWLSRAVGRVLNPGDTGSNILFLSIFFSKAPNKGGGVSPLSPCTNGTSSKCVEGNKIVVMWFVTSVDLSNVHKTSSFFLFFY